MKILFCGDVVGKNGRDVVSKYVPKLKKHLDIDMVVLNGENSAHGFGINPDIADLFFKNGVDVITLGNHSFDQQIIVEYINNNPSKIIRPLNYKNDMAGSGFCVITLKNNLKVLVVNLMGTLFMGDRIALKNPFYEIENLLNTYVLGKNINAIVVDFHAEATSEKNAILHFLQGKVSMICGTHSHIPTLDFRIKNGTAYQTDVGMCGNYDSVIGMNKEASLGRFLDLSKKLRLSPEDGDATFCGIYVEINDSTGLATYCYPVILGNLLHNFMPYSLKIKWEESV